MRRFAGLGVGGLVIAAFALFGAARCTYSPDPESGTLHCSVSGHLCPEGYTCDLPSDTCYKTGMSPSGAAGSDGGAGTSGTAGTTGAAGTGGKGGSTGTPCAGMCTIKIEGTLMNGSTSSDGNKFVGHWVYQTGSTEKVSCTDGSDQTNNLAADYVDVTASGGGLVGDYFCPWNLTVGPAGNATIIKAGQSCSRNVTDPTMGTTKFTWHGMTFTLTTVDGKTATLVSTIGVDYVDDPTKTGCTP